jgi:hypothetical protein
MSRGHGKWEVATRFHPGYIRTRTHVAALRRAAGKLIDEGKGDHDVHLRLVITSLTFD